MNIINKNYKHAFINLIFKRCKKLHPICHLEIEKSYLYDEDRNPLPRLHPETPRFQNEYGIKPDFKGKIYDQKPFEMICEPNKVYWWCSCGHSKTQPLCDGHHKILLKSSPKYFSKESKFQPIKNVFEKRTRIWWCNCKQTSSPPFCDGSHLMPNVQSITKK